MMEITHPARKTESDATPIPGTKNLGWIPNGRGGKTMVKMNWFEPIELLKPPKPVK